MAAMAADRSPYGSRPQVSVDGSPLPADITPALVRVLVHTHVHLPGMFVLHFQDTHHDVLSRAGIKFGSKLTVAATADGDGTLLPLVAGEVTALEQESDGTGTWTVVRGYDPLHRLCRGRRTRTFAGVTDADIVRQVAADAQLDLGATDPGGLRGRAPRHGADAPAGGDDLAAPAQPYQLLLGGNLRRFRPRVTAAEQVGEVQVRGWDPAAKQERL